MRVVVTRPQAQAEPLLNALRAEGFEAVACPVIETEAIDDGPIDVSGYDWVIVTSANGAVELAARHRGELPRVAAVGEATAAALAAGLTVVAEAVTQDVAGLVDSAALWRASSHF